MDSSAVILIGFVSVVICTAYLTAAYHKAKKEKNPKPYKIGLDIHGVTDTSPEFFSRLSNLFGASGAEVHIITGSEMSIEIEQQLADLNIYYTHFFSITDYHKNIGTEVTYSAPGHPVISPELWDKTKADYCARMEINIMIDDSTTYGQYFTTPYMRVKIEK